MEIFWFFLSVAVVIAVYQLISLGHYSRAEGRRIGRLMGAAEKLGLKFIRTPDWGAKGWVEERIWVAQEVGNRYRGFEPFDQTAVAVRNFVTGKMGELEFEAFEVEMVTRESEGRPLTDWYFVSSAKMPVQFPGICLGDFQRWKSTRVAVEYPAFNERYPVRSEDPEFAFGLIHERMIEFLMQSNIPDLQVGGARAVFVYLGKIDAEFVLASARFFEQFWNLVPEYMKEDWKA